MPKRLRNQHKAKKDRADRRKKAKKLGFVRPIIARHQRGPQPGDQKKKKKRKRKRRGRRGRRERKQNTYLLKQG